MCGRLSTGQGGSAASLRLAVPAALLALGLVGLLGGCGSETGSAPGETSVTTQPSPTATQTTGGQAETTLDQVETTEQPATTGRSDATTPSTTARTVAGSPLKIVAVNSNAPGDDNANLNEESVTFEVLVSGSLIGYSVEDESGNHYDFPDRSFEAGRLVTLHTGSGADTQTHLYWDSDSEVWNNGSDTVTVFDPRGRVIIDHLYFAPAGDD